MFFYRKCLGLFLFLVMAVHAETPVAKVEAHLYSCNSADVLFEAKIMKKDGFRHCAWHSCQCKVGNFFSHGIAPIRLKITNTSSDPIVISRDEADSGWTNAERSVFRNRSGALLGSGLCAAIGGTIVMAFSLPQDRPYKDFNPGLCKTGFGAFVAGCIAMYIGGAAYKPKGMDNAFADMKASTLKSDKYSTEALLFAKMKQLHEDTKMPEKGLVVQPGETVDKLVYVWVGYSDPQHGRYWAERVVGLRICNEQGVLLDRKAWAFTIYLR